MVVQRTELGMRLEQLCCGWVLGSHADLSSCPPELVTVTWDRAVCTPRVQRAQEGPHH